MKVVGFGDNVVDRYINKNIMFPGGNAVNFAVYAKKSSVNSAYLGVFGDDKEAKWIKHALTDMGIDLSKCITVENSTTERCDVKIVNGDRVFVGDDLRETKPEPMILTEEEIDYLADFDLIHSGCYASSESELPKLKGLNSIVTFDFSVEEEFKSDEYLKKVCPYIDFALFSCEGMELEDINRLQKKVHNLGTKYVLITKGVEGQILYDGKDYHKGVVELVEAVDTMGAGDSFFTSFVMTLLKQGWRKNVDLSKEMIETAFQTAAKFSAGNCLVEGAFGYAKQIED